MQNARDFRPDIHAAIAVLHRAGLDPQGYVLAAAMEGAYGTALEMVQAIGSAVMRVERALGADLPAEAKTTFQRALAEVGRVVILLTSQTGGTLSAATPALPSALAPCSSS